MTTKQSKVPGRCRTCKQMVWEHVPGVIRKGKYTQVPRWMLQLEIFTNLPGRERGFILMLPAISALANLLDYPNTPQPQKDLFEKLVKQLYDDAYA